MAAVGYVGFTLSPGKPAHTVAATPIPGPLTKAGAELRVLSPRGIAATPLAVRPRILALRTNGGYFRQNAHVSCYLNASGTARVCALVIRSGTKPWVDVAYRVQASGAVVYKGYSLRS